MTADTVLTDAQCLSIGTFGQSPLKRLEHARAIEQAVLQSEQVQAWKKDAERYRHLRDDGEIGPHDLFNAWWLSEHGNPQTLDAAIDAAMEKQP